MTSPTHITFAGFIYLLLLTTTGVALNAVNMVVIAIASIMPDIDTAASFVGRAFPFISKRVERHYGHRTLTHSVTFIAVLAIVLTPLLLLSRDLYVCSLIGYASHPFLDTMTVNGVKLFYPFSTVKCVFPFEVNNPHRYRLQTGSKLDHTLALLFFLGCIPTFLVARQGYERFIRTTQKNIESAVRDYNQYSRDHFVLADFAAYNMMTKERLEGTFEIIGALDQTTVLFKGEEGRIHSLGKEYNAEYVAEWIVCKAGEQAITKVTSVDMSNQLLSQLVVHLESPFESRLFGALSSGDPLSIPQESNTFSLISGSFSTVKFNYATYRDIQRLNLENIFITKGTLTVRTVLKKEETSLSPDLQPSALRPMPHALGPMLSATPPMPHAPGSMPPAAPTFLQLSFELDPKESIDLLHQVGDTVTRDDALIKRDLARFYNQQIELNERRILALRQELDFGLADLGHKHALAEKALADDSTGFAHAQQQYSTGFTTELAVGEARRRYEFSRDAVAQLLSAQERLQTKYLIDRQRLANDIAQLRSREKAAIRQSEMRSTASGIIRDIRQLYHNNKLQITFVLERLPDEPRPQK